MNELLILDVAHGNSALLVSGSAVAVFDAAPKDVLLRTIDLYEIKEIDYLYLSHLDKDHVGGLANILASNRLIVKNLIVNPDSTKSGIRNTRLRIIVEDAVHRHGLKLHVAMEASPDVTVGEVTVKALAPSVAEFLSGPGGSDAQGNMMDSNSASVVLQLTHEGHPIALLAADMDQRTLNTILRRGQNLASDVLIFPHHGGNCANTDAQNAEFAEQLADLVKPQVTIFSMGRTEFANPRKEIVDAVRKAVPNTHISCTQLSTNCLKTLPQGRPEWQAYLSDLPGAGHDHLIACGGSLRFRLRGDQTQYPSGDGLHAKFIKLHVVQALCNLNTDY